MAHSFAVFDAVFSFTTAAGRYFDAKFQTERPVELANVHNYLRGV